MKTGLDSAGAGKAWGVSLSRMALGVFMVACYGCTPSREVQQLPAGVVEATLNSPEVVEYLHLEVPARRPVRVKASYVPSDLHEVTGNAVLIVHDGTPDAFEFTRARIRGDEYVVNVSYPIEGMHGELLIAHGRDGWFVKSADIWEE